MRILLWSIWLLDLLDMTMLFDVQVFQPTRRKLIQIWPMFSRSIFISFDAKWMSRSKLFSNNAQYCANLICHLSFLYIFLSSSQIFHWSSEVFMTYSYLCFLNVYRNLSLDIICLFKVEKIQVDLFSLVSTLRNILILKIWWQTSKCYILPL